MAGIRSGLIAAALGATVVSATAARAAGDLPDRLLVAHNAERARAGTGPLAWNPALARQAQAWADQLAARGALQHAADTGNAGENLWMGTAGRYPPEAMVGAFAGERHRFRPGRFPLVSDTGWWADVGHYTQMIWPTTREVGCAIARSGQWDVLVCRYLPAGNIHGQPVP